MPGKPYWWQWPTILSLDAPAVVLLWQWSVAGTAGATLRWPHRLVLGASVWLAYAADRWIEGWHLRPESVRTQRHHFYQRHRRALAVVWLLVATADVSVAATGLNAREFQAGLLLLAPVLAYVLSHQFAHRHHRWRLPKEICVAVLLAGGVGLFPAVQVTGGNVAPFAGTLSLFALLCFTNCALISTWEHTVDRAHGQTSLALRFTQAAAFSRALPWIVVILAGVQAGYFTGPARVAAGCAAGSGLLLAGIDWLERRTHWQLARVLADAALLTPLLAALWR